MRIFKENDKQKILYYWKITKVSEKEMNEWENKGQGGDLEETAWGDKDSVGGWKGHPHGKAFSVDFVRKVKKLKFASSLVHSMDGDRIISKDFAFSLILGWRRTTSFAFEC